MLKSFRAYKKHSKICTGKKCQVKLAESLQRTLFWQCKRCFEKIEASGKEGTADFDLIVKHLYKHTYRGEKIICPVCGVDYHVYKTFSRHILQHKRREETNIVHEEHVIRTSVNVESDFDLNSIADLGSDIDLPEDSYTIDETNDSMSTPVNKSLSPIDLFKLKWVIEKNEALFALKLTSKYLLTREAVNDIFSFSRDIHSLKMEFITSKLEQSYLNDDNLDISDIKTKIDLLDHIAGFGPDLLTHFKREKILNSHFDFIHPEKRVIGTIKNEMCFYYYLPVTKTLSRLMRDDSVREFIIHQPLFDKQSVCS